MPKMAVITTVSASVTAFYIDQLKGLNKAGIKTVVLCADAPALRKALPDGTDFIPFQFTRAVSPFKDIAVLWRLFRYLRRERFDIVQYSTLKASFLGSIASFLARVPVRIFAIWGFYFEGQKGLRRALFRFLDKVMCSISTVVLPDSGEMIDFLENDGLSNRSKCDIILNGSACGVDLEKYDPEKWRPLRGQIRGRLNIPVDGIVIGVFGRLTGDKGVNEIVTAFQQIATQFDNVFLLVVGVREEKDKLLPETERTIVDHPKIKSLGWQETLLPYYAAIDIFCLPSYREGFPQSPLEAQAMEVPVIASNIIGVREAVLDNETGFLVQVKSSEALIEPLKKLILDPKLRRQMGQRGRERVKLLFDSKDVTRAAVEHKLKLLKK